MFKLILSLIKNRASIKDWQFQIGAKLLKKGCGQVLGEVLYEKKVIHVKDKIMKVKVIKDLTFDFRTNKLHVATENKMVKPSDLVKA